MDNVMKLITGFFGGLGSVLMAVVPVSILWYVLTGGAVFDYLSGNTKRGPRILITIGQEWLARLIVEPITKSKKNKKTKK